MQNKLNNSFLFFYAAKVIKNIVKFRQKFCGNSAENKMQPKTKCSRKQNSVIMQKILQNCNFSVQSI